MLRRSPWSPGLSTIVVTVGFLLSGCQAESAPFPPSIDEAVLQFSGDEALQTESEFVLAFPNRHSGEQNNRLAAAWLLDSFAALGLDCHIDEWSVVNYSRPVGLNNVVCRLPGDSDQEILLTAHLDQAPTTIEGADNDGSGIAILLQLAEIFAAEPRHPYTLAFVATDAEEYGMLGSSRYVSTHPNPQNILAGISLDNLGRSYYDGMNMELIGQFRGYGPIWLPLAARDAARAPGIQWQVYLRSPLDQAIDQAAPVSLMDQGPMVAAGIPAFGFAGHVPPELSALHTRLWHDPEDDLSYQSADSLGQSGLIVEALVRRLLSMKTFPRESGPYLYFDETRQVLRGAPLLLIFAAFVAVFLVGSYMAGPRPLAAIYRGWTKALPHLISLWAPLLLSFTGLYLMVAVGLLDTYARYPATTKDPLLYYPRWPAVILFLASLSVFFVLGRRLARRVYISIGAVQDSETRSLGYLALAVSAAYILAVNPFALLFMLPCLFWLLMWKRKGPAAVFNIVLFALGGLLVYATVYMFGFVVLTLNWAFLWYMLNMFSTRMIPIGTMVVTTAIVAAGLSLLVPVPSTPMAARVATKSA
jgi:hypothetical protein